MEPIFFVDSKTAQQNYSNGTIKTTFTYVTQDADGVPKYIGKIKIYW